MISFSRQNNTIIVLKDYCIINIIRSIHCRVCCVAGTINNYFIPTGKGVGISIICRFSGSTRFDNIVAVMICLGRQNNTIIIFKYNRIVDIIRRICCCIGCITGAVGYWLIPSCKRICIRCIWCLVRISRDFNCIAITIGFCWNNWAIMILKGNSILYKFRSKHCCIYFITVTSTNHTIPARKYVLIL